MLKIAMLGVVFALPVVMLIQLGFMPIAMKTLRSKHLNKNIAWLVLIPYVGIVAAYWVACAPSKA